MPFPLSSACSASATCRWSWSLFLWGHQKKFTFIQRVFPQTIYWFLLCARNTELGWRPRVTGTYSLAGRQTFKQAIMQDRRIVKGERRSAARGGLPLLSQPLPRRLELLHRCHPTRETKGPFDWEPSNSAWRSGPLVILSGTLPALVLDRLVLRRSSSSSWAESNLSAYNLGSTSAWVF